MSGIHIHPGAYTSVWCIYKCVCKHVQLSVCTCASVCKHLRLCLNMCDCLSIQANRRRNKAEMQAADNNILLFGQWYRKKQEAKLDKHEAKHADKLLPNTHKLPLAPAQTPLRKPEMADLREFVLVSLSLCVCVCVCVCVCERVCLRCANLRWLIFAMLS